MNKNLGMNLFDSIDIEPASDLAADISELTIDMLIKNETLRSIPIVGLLVKSANAVLSVRDFLLIKKIITFLRNLGEIDHNTRAKFVNRIDSKEKINIGEQLLLLLERHETIVKSEMLAKVFKAYILNEISREDFDKISYSIDRLFVPDIESFLNFSSEPVNNKEEHQRLYFSGLLIIDFLDQTWGNLSGDVANYVLSDLGEKLLTILYPDR